MSLPLVSTVIPAHNAEGFLAEALDSALGQTHPRHEVVVIDDASTDRTREVLHAYADRIVWESIPRGGAARARNRGLEIARGEFVQFLDADDLVDRRKLAVQVPLLLESGADMVFCAWETVSFNSGGEAKSSSLRLKSDDPVEIALGHAILTPTPLHRRKNLVDVGGFSPELPCCQDYELHLKLACSGYSSLYHDDVLVTVRRRRNSISDDSRVLYTVWPGIYKSCFRMLTERGGMTSRRAAAFAARMTLAGRVLAAMGEAERAMECFREARRMHPSGGVNRAYDRKSRVIRAILGPIGAERIIKKWQRIRKGREP